MADFMENTLGGVQQPVVAAPSAEKSTVDAVPGAVVEPQETPPTGDGPQGKPPKPVQSAEENKANAAIRRRLEAKEQSEAAALEAFRKMGFAGGNLEELTAQIVAHQQGITVEQYQQQQEQQRERMAQLQELEALRQERAQRVFDADLATIQKLDPKVTAIDDLGERFVQLRAAGVDAATAYYAIAQATPKPIAPQMGDVDSGGSVQPENPYATMSNADFEKVLAAAKRGELMKG